MKNFIYSILILVIYFPTFSQKELITVDLSLKPDTAFIKRFPTINIYRGYTVLNTPLYKTTSNIPISNNKLEKLMLSINDENVSKKVNQSKVFKYFGIPIVILGSAIAISSIQKQTSQTPIFIGFGIGMVGSINRYLAIITRKKSIKLYNQRVLKGYYLK